MMYECCVTCGRCRVSSLSGHNEHDFLVLGLRNNGLEVVKGGLDLLTTPVLSPSPCSVPVRVPDYETGYTDTITHRPNEVAAYGKEGIS